MWRSACHASMTERVELAASTLRIRSLTAANMSGWSQVYIQDGHASQPLRRWVGHWLPGFGDDGDLNGMAFWILRVDSG